MMIIFVVHENAARTTPKLLDIPTEVLFPVTGLPSEMTSTVHEPMEKAFDGSIKVPSRGAE